MSYHAIIKTDGDETKSIAKALELHKSRPHGSFINAKSMSLIIHAGSIRRNEVARSLLFPSPKSAFVNAIEIRFGYKVSKETRMSASEQEEADDNDGGEERENGFCVYSN